VTGAGAATTSSREPGPRPRRPPVAATAVAAAAVLLSLATCRVDGGEPEPTNAADARQVAIGEVRWYVDYDAAVAVAREEDKPLWVHFGENPG